MGPRSSIKYSRNHSVLFFKAPLCARTCSGCRRSSYSYELDRCYLPTKSVYSSRWEGCRHVIHYVIRVHGSCFKGVIGVCHARGLTFRGKVKLVFPKGGDFELRAEA